MGKYVVLLVLILCLLAVVACKTSKQNEGEPPTKEITFTGNSGGNQRLPDSPYGYEMWTAGGSNSKLTWYGPDQKGGAAFRAEWNNPNDFLGRIGYFWNQNRPYTYYKNLYCDFEFTRSGRNTAGDYSYIGIYGWSVNPLIEYYIVEDWFGNQWQSDYMPVGANTILSDIPQAERHKNEKGSYTIDDSVYKVYQKTRTGPSITGNTTFQQYFSIRQTQRKIGTISITEHFKEWEKIGMMLGTNMYEAKFLVEAGGGTGWFDASYLSFEQKDE